MKCKHDAFYYMPYIHTLIYNSTQVLLI